MIIGYKKQFPWGLPTCFKGKIKDGTKKHTIRADKHERWKTGIKIQHAYGVRTKFYESFQENECISTQRIRILPVDNNVDKQYYVCCKKTNGVLSKKQFKVTVDNKQLEWKDIVRLAHNDGFDSADDFFKWFWDGFTGKIIHWTDLRY